MRVVPRESSSHFPRPDRATQLINFPPNSPQIFTAARTELLLVKFPGFRSGLRFIRVVVNRSGVGFTADQFPQVPLRRAPRRISSFAEVI